MKRRDFIVGAAAFAAASKVVGQKAAAEPTGPAKIDRISIMSICFNPVLKSPAFPNDSNRTLDILDFPRMIADRYGVHWIELQHSHFISTEAEYIKDFRARMDKVSTRMTQINLEFGPLNISTPDPVLRLETIDLTKRWIDHAAALGCPRVMLNQGTLPPEIRPAAIETLRTVAEYGRSKNVFITMENKDDGQSLTPAPGALPRHAAWDVVVDVIKSSGIYANPDVGNFPDNVSRAPGLRALFPLSSGSCHCHYAPEKYSEAESIRISKEVGYKGLYSIEAVKSNGPDPYAAVQTILDELLRDV